MQTNRQKADKTKLTEAFSYLCERALKYTVVYDKKVRASSDEKWIPNFGPKT